MLHNALHDARLEGETGGFGEVAKILRLRRPIGATRKVCAKIWISHR